MREEKNNYLSAQVIILGEQGARESNGEEATQGEVAEVLLTMEGVQVRLQLWLLVAPIVFPVQVFTVAADGEVSTPSYPETLHLVKVSRKMICVV